MRLYIYIYQVIYMWVPINLIGKVFNGCIRDLWFYGSYFYKAAIWHNTIFLQLKQFFFFFLFVCARVEVTTKIVLTSWISSLVILPFSLISALKKRKNALNFFFFLFNIKSCAGINNGRNEFDTLTTWIELFNILCNAR